MSYEVMRESNGFIWVILETDGREFTERWRPSGTLGNACYQVAELQENCPDLVFCLVQTEEFTVHQETPTL